MAVRRGCPGLAVRRGCPGLAVRRGTIPSVKGLSEFFRANPQVLILLIICLVLGLGTFLAIVFDVVSSGTTVTNGYSSGAIFGLPALLG